MERVGRARVLGDRTVVVVDLPGALVEDHVLEDRAEHAGRPVDLGLAGGRETDRLGVAAALEVEDAVVAPAVLVVADQPAVRVGRQGGLPRAGEPEEERRVAALADVGGAVHGKDSPGGQKEVERREDRLLDLAGVRGAADQHDPFREVDDDEGAGVGAVPRGIGLHGGGVIHDEIGIEAVLLPGFEPQEHVVGEEVVPRALGDHAHVDPVAPVRPRPWRRERTGRAR